MSRRKLTDRHRQYIAEMENLSRQTSPEGGVGRISYAGLREV